MAEKKVQNMKRKSFIIWRLLIIAPFIIGIIGFMREGFPFAKSAYASFCFYFVSVYSTVSNPFLEFARWTAPIVLCSGILWSLRGALFMFKNIYMSMDPKATVIYHDANEGDNAELLAENINKAFTERALPGKPLRFYSDVPNQIVMFSKDFDNLDFVTQHFDELKNKNVRVQITSVDSSLLDSSNFIYFNRSEIIASMYWSKYPIYNMLDNDQKEIDIVIIGSNELAEKIIISALLTNLYSEDQAIHYHVFGRHRGFQFVYNDNSYMNNDTITFYDDIWINHRELLEKSERIIYADTDYDPLETLLYALPNVPIYYYSDYDDKASSIFLRKNIHNFGSSKSVYTYENVISSKRYRYARELHYLSIDPEKGFSKDAATAKLKAKEWDKLDGFIQSSYKSCVDYHIHLQNTGCLPSLTPDGIKLAAKLEHIRQCRFYFINGWRHGAEDIEERYNICTHESRILVPFEELTPDVLEYKLNNSEFLLHVLHGPYQEPIPVTNHD